MERFLTILASLFFCIGSVYAEGEKKVIPKDNEWEETNERDTSSPQLYQSESSVYVYSEKQLDNVTIGITDMLGNTYHYEVTTVPACTYYAVSIDSLPAGMYYLCVYQGNKSMIGLFTVN